MPLNEKKIFLAGSAGMAGTSILKHLLDNNSAAGIRASYHRSRPVIDDERVDYVQGDLRSVDECRKMARGCDCAIMAAAYAGGADFLKSFPWEHMKENLLMNIGMLEAFRAEGVKRVIFISSAAVYQQFEGHIKEEDLDFNKEPYDVYFGFSWAMRFIEKMCKFLNCRFGMEVAVVRLANIFGPYDKFDPKRSNFIPALIRKAADKMDPYEVWGSPEVTRDVLYADDFAGAISLMTELDGLKYEVFNIGSGVKTTVGDVVKWALKYTGHAASEVKYIQGKPTTIKFRALDCLKAREVLGWKPQHSMEEGVKKTAEWWMENKDQWKR